MTTATTTTADEPAPPRPALTKRQRDVLRFLVDYWGTHGAPPALREICAHFGIRSPNGIVCSLTALAAKGYIDWSRDGKARGACVPELLAAARTAADDLLRTIE